jgi:uncharacterized protein (DUF885 family)
VTFDPASPVNVLADRFWEAFLEQRPEMATVYGDDRFGDRLEDRSEAGRAARRSLFERTAADARAIPEAGLSTEDRITRDVLIVIADLAVEQDEQRIELLQVVDQMEGPQTVLAQLVQFQPADTPDHLDQLLARLHAYGPFIDQNIELVRESVASGLTPPRVTTERTIAQLERLLAIPIDEAVIPSMAVVNDEAARERIRDVVRDVVYPADARFLDAVRASLPASRVDPGLWSAPNGEALYQTQIRAWTTLDISPEEVHRIGLEDLTAIQDEQRVIARAAGFGGDLAAYRAHLIADPANHPATADAMLARAREDIERAFAEAPKAFGRLPRAGCEVKAVEAFKEKDSPFAYYFPPTTDGSRGGTYYANTYDLPSRMYSTLATTTYHEAVPGHHFQISLETENDRLTTFRRLGARLTGGAYIEGWGLYAEGLADELGLFRNEQERFGMLGSVAWRAARLVVDSGIHALRWTRQQSIDFLLAVGLTETDAIIETDRYITLPAQALTYKLGQRLIIDLRRQLEARDGSSFDLRTFHDELLGHGSLPLATLARELPRWASVPA